MCKAKQLKELLHISLCPTFNLMHVFREREATVLSFESFQTIISGVAFVLGKAKVFMPKSS